MAQIHPSTLNPFFSPNPSSFEMPARAERPFAAAAADPSEQGYAMVKSHPAVNPSEVELASVRAIEVMVRWGGTVLHVAHLSPPRPFYLGERATKTQAIDYVLPAEKLGTDRLPVVTLQNGEPCVVVPAGAKADFRDVTDEGTPFAELGGARCIRLDGHSRASITLGDLTIEVASVPAGKPSRRQLMAASDSSSAVFFGLSALTAAAFVGAMAFFTPPLGLTADDGVGAERVAMIQQYLQASAEREVEARETPRDEPSDDVAESGERGEAARGEEGQMGKATATATNKRISVKGDGENQQLSRHEARALAENFGMIGLLATSAGDPNVPAVPWGGDIVNGDQDASLHGGMFGDAFGESYGKNGLGLSGIGESGGGRGAGIGLGGIGTCGAAVCPGLGGEGFSTFRGGPREHVTRTPVVRIGHSVTSGKLPPEVIQRIVRQNYGRFRMCYEDGLRANPNLEGRVTARFVIDRTGAVSNVGNGGSDLPDSNVVSCVVRAFYGLSFPAPDGGIVTVSYPIMFSPGG